MAIVTGRSLVASFCYRSRQSFIIGNAINSLENKLIDANNADLLHTLYRRWRWHPLAKTWASLDKNKTNAWLDNMIGNFRLSQPTPRLFWRNFVSRCRGNKWLVNHFIMNVPGAWVFAVCKQSAIRLSFYCKRQRIRILLKQVDPKTFTNPGKSPLVSEKNSRNFAEFTHKIKKVSKCFWKSNHKS